jgi:hypothetical protein
MFQMLSSPNPLLELQDAGVFSYFGILDGKRHLMAGSLKIQFAAQLSYGTNLA